MRPNNTVLFGRHIHVLRKRAGYSLGDLAEKLDIDKGILRLIEQGRSDSISDDMLDEMYQLIGLSLSRAPGVDPPPMQKKKIEGELSEAKRWIK